MPRLRPPLAPALLALYLWAAAAPAAARGLAAAAPPPSSPGGPLANLTAARDAVQAIVDESGPLSVCVSAFRPYTTIRNGSYAGMDIEIWRRIAHDLELAEGADYVFTPYAAFEVRLVLVLRLVRRECSLQSTCRARVAQGGGCCATGRHGGH